MNPGGHSFVFLNISINKKPFFFLGVVVNKKINSSNVSRKLGAIQPGYISLIILLYVDVDSNERDIDTQIT
jgi:hypothetical protein